MFSDCSSCSPTLKSSGTLISYDFTPLLHPPSNLFPIEAMHIKQLGVPHTYIPALLLLQQYYKVTYYYYYYILCIERKNTAAAAIKRAYNMIVTVLL